MRIQYARPQDTLQGSIQSHHLSGTWLGSMLQSVSQEEIDHSILMRITKAYATISTAGVLVLIWVLLINLLLEQRTAFFSVAATEGGLWGVAPPVKIKLL